MGLRNIKSSLDFAISPKFVPAAAKFTSKPAASSVISPATSKTRLPADSKSPFVPSCVIFKSESAPMFKTALSDNKNKSSPITASNATDRPPSVCKEPSVVLVAFVVLSVFKTPLKVPVVADRVLAPTIVPLTSKLPLRSTSVEFNSISSSAFISKSPSAGEPILIAESLN